MVLASLGAYMVTISSSQHLGGALDLEGSRALQAARAGLDWGMAKAVISPTAFGAGNCRTGAVTVNLTTGSGGDFTALSGFTVTVTCSGVAYTDGTNSLYSYALTSTACNQPNGSSCPNTGSSIGVGYAERRLTSQVTCNATLPC